MKKYNNFDRHMVLLGIIIPFLVFFISMNTTYAYFTATATKKESTTTTATIKITLNNVDDTVTNSSGVTTSSAEEGVVNKILPGDTLKVTGSLLNAGSSTCYAILEFTVDITKENASSAERHTRKYYTFENSADGTTYTQKSITGTPNNYSVNAGTIVKDGERSFSLTYVFTGAEYGNEYKNATATYRVRAHAIQTENLASTEAESAKVATNLLMDNVGYASTVVYGNSVQDTTATPSPSNPVEIQSVGDKTVNLFNFEKVKGQISGVADYENESIFLSSDENLYIIGQSFTGAPTAFNKFNEVLNITDPGYYCLRVKVTSEETDIMTRASWDLNVIGTGAVAPTVVTNTYKDGYLFVKYNITQECLDSLKNNAETFRLYMYAFRKTSTADNVDTTVSEFMFVHGDYTFETMPEYEPYGKYKISVDIQTKNLFQIENAGFVGTTLVSYSANTTNKFVFENPTSASANYISSENLAAFGLKPNTTYSSRVKITEEILASGGASSGSMNNSLILQDNKSYSSNTKIYIVKGFYDNPQIDSEGYYYTRFTTPADLTSLKYIVARLTGYSTVAYSNLMIVEGDYTMDNFPTYEPYIGTKNIYLDEPLRKVGDVMDCLDFETGLVKRNIKSIKLDENHEFFLYEYASCYGVYLMDVLDDSYDRIPGLSNIANPSNVGKYYQSGAIWLLGSSVYIIGTLTELGFADGDNFESTWQTDFLAWIKENPIEIIYATNNAYEEKTECLLIPEGAKITINTTVAQPTFDS